MRPSQIRHVDAIHPINGNPLSGWDIGLSAVALACMTAGLWRLWPEAVGLDNAPLGFFIVKAGIASLGFVGIATRWEDTLRAFAANPLPLVLMALACSSAIWALTPTDAVRNAIMLIVIWGFGIALALRFNPRELAEICAFAGLFGILGQFAAHQGIPPVTAYDGDIAFAIMGSAWAAWQVPARKTFWLLALGCCALLALGAGDIASLGAASGLGLGIGVARLGAARARNGRVSVILTAWVLVALIIGVTLFALFGVDPVTAKISSFFDSLGPNMLLGQGIGVAGQSFATGIGAGLGIVGVLLMGLLAFATLFQVLLGERRISDGVAGNIAIWFAAIGAILFSPGEVALFGPVCVLFATTSFAISLSCIRVPRRRQPLFNKAIGFQAQVKRTSAPIPLMKAPKNMGRKSVRQTDSLTSLGLRPKL
jgi:hypothetical protein